MGTVWNMGSHLRPGDRQVKHDGHGADLSKVVLTVQEGMCIGGGK